MIRIESMRDLRQLGIDMLTGEACAYMRRILCGLTEAGAELVTDFYGIKREGLREPWNSYACDEPAAGSFMLPNSLEANLDLAVVGLFKLGCVEVWEPRLENLWAKRGPNGDPERVSYEQRRLETPDAFKPAGYLLGIQQEDLESDFFKRRTLTVEAGDGDFWLQDHVYILRRMHNPGRSRNQHAMSGRVE